LIAPIATARSIIMNGTCPEMMSIMAGALPR
jgi:hypothetical protein